MHIEVLCEDKSGSVVLEHIIATWLADRKSVCSFEIRAHRGKGKLPNDYMAKPMRFASGLMDLLPAKVRAYAEIFRPEDLFLIIVMDSDDESADKIYVDLERVVQKFGQRIPYVIGVSVEEMESWLLGDRQALLKAFPEIHRTVLDNYEQDSICGTWEVLARAIYGREAERLIRIGYPAVGQYKYEWASRIAPFMQLEQNQSPSFQKFLKKLNRIMNKQEQRFVKIQ